MSWRTRYWLPWRLLDVGRIEDAALAAAKVVGGIPVEVQTCAPDHVACFFLVPVELARQSDLSGEFDTRLKQQEAEKETNFCVQIDFMTYAEESAYRLPLTCEFFFDTANSQNWFCDGIGLRLLEEIDTFFGADWEPG